ncbi:iron complex transport system ATP-binding protein [Haloferula luteola]|uniref:Iron complex transport system ATP-binding protein n=1 Tax=Haloferula luteola TaxID=595692 RepID=A0A840V4T3_9BACT|nr:ABC transporter ATP-binding protein [Haloferula luteola]MBB5352583.1 iron complex transport system ATP-binding protein [Haloferula luteola]
MNPTTSLGLTAMDLRVRYSSRQPEILRQVSLAIPDGCITVLIGPNGSGKSTLLKTLARQLTPESGEVLLGDQSIHRLAPGDFARTLGILFQEHRPPGEITVEELALHGRYPHSRFLHGPTSDDFAAVEKALNLTDLAALRHRPVAELSGGQRQLAWIAMALTQETRFLFLDEPTTFLDLAHQFDLMELVVRMKQEMSKTLVLVLHDLHLAARYADHLVMLHQGKIACQGPPSQVLTSDHLRQVFEIEATITQTQTGHIHCFAERRAAPPPPPTSASSEK